MFENISLKLNMVHNKDGVEANISCKDLTDNIEYQATVSGENVQEVLDNLYDQLLDDIEQKELEEMDESEYIYYLESRIEELEEENEILREQMDEEYNIAKGKYKTDPATSKEIRDIFDRYFDKYFV